MPNEYLKRSISVGQKSLAKRIEEFLCVTDTHTVMVRRVEMGFGDMVYSIESFNSRSEYNTHKSTYDECNEQVFTAVFRKAKESLNRIVSNK